jgi:hypothetical protein
MLFKACLVCFYAAVELLPLVRLCLQNSWGADWGDEGYLKIARHSSPLDAKGPGTCGIALSASYPVIDDKLAIAL